MENMNIHQKMAAVEQSIPTIAKNQTVKTGGSSFQAVGKDDILEHVNKAHKNHGIKCNVNYELISSQVMEKQSKSGYAQLVTYVEFKATGKFINIEKPEEYVEITAYGQGVDTGDKAHGKGQSYALKNLYTNAAYNIKTGEASEDEVAQAKKESAKQRFFSYARKQSEGDVKGAIDYALNQLGVSDASELDFTPTEVKLLAQAVNKYVGKEEPKKKQEVEQV